MDFNSLAANQPFYILQKSGKPVLQVGVVKTKSDQRPPYQTQTPNVFSGLQMGKGNVVDVTVTVDGGDIPFNNLPAAAESTTYNGGDTFVSCSREATLQAVDTMIQASRKALDQVGYHNTVLQEGEKMLEALNPRYAEEKQRDRTIQELVEHRKETDSKLDQILKFMSDIAKK